MQIPTKNVNRKILVVGDLHGEWRQLNFLIAKHRPQKVLQVGDFGWWPKFHNTTMLSSGVYRSDPMFPGGFRKEMPWKQFSLRTGDAVMHFCPGNHEDWEDLELRATSDSPTPVELFKNVVYMPRCSVLKLEDGRNVLFLGGGHSIDKNERIPGYDWFPNELITQRDIHNLPDIKIDIVISHVCPIEFKYDFNSKLKYNQYNGTNYDSSCDALSVVLRKYNPSLWFFGHYHIFYTAMFNNTRWYCLNKIGDSGWWMYLPD